MISFVAFIAGYLVAAFISRARSMKINRIHADTVEMLEEEISDLDRDISRLRGGK